MSTGHIFTPPEYRKDCTEAVKPYLHSFHKLFVDKCMEHADRTAFICAMTGRTVPYKQSLGTTKRLSGYFYHKHGIRAGDVVAVMIPNTPEWVCVFQGIIGLGAVVSPVNSMFSAFEIEKQLKASKAKLLVSVSHFAAQVEEGVKDYNAAESAAVEALILDKSDAIDPAVAVDPVPEDYTFESKPEDVVALPFSSGTTGLPKGVQLTNSNLVWNLFQTIDGITFDEKSMMMAVLPYFHIYGMIVILHGTMLGGGTQIVMPKFDMVQYLDLVDKHKATHLCVAPPIIVGFIKHPKTKTIDTSSVKYVISGAAPLGEEVQKMCEPLFPNALVGQGYGLTETSPVISLSPAGTAVYGSAGVMVANTEIRVVKVAESESDENVNLGPNEGEGELWVRGPQVMKGYLREEDNKIVFPEPGWFRTGDLVKIDAEGHITVTDRIKELIKYKGYQVAPAELEALIQTHPFVQETIVIGIADKEEGAGNEVPMAHVVLKPTVTEEQRPTAAKEIQDFVDNKVAPYKKLRGGLKIVDSIPKTASGKLLRRVVRDQENAAKKAEEVAAPAVEKEDTLDYFLDICSQFKLGDLPTESSHPKTENLSTLAKEDLPAAFKVLQDVDVAALSALLDAKVQQQIQDLASTIHDVFAAGRQVFSVGCGATGRLSISLEAFALDGMVPEPEYQNKVKGFMAGGDAALIRSIEKFEDRNEFGKKQLHELDFQDGDLLLAITEGGETPFVIAACEEAVVSSPSRPPFFLYCNPDDILSKVAKRSQNVLENDKITKINLSCGNMAITGSTRMQATSIQVLAAGLALRHHADPSQIPISLQRFVAAIKGAGYERMAPLTQAEAKLYSDGEKFLYETSFFSMTVMTDTTERAPTFSLPPFESFKEGSKDETSPVYLTLSGTSTVEESWKSLLRRDWRPLEWEDTKDRTGLAALQGYDFSSGLVAKRRAAAGEAKTQHRVVVNKTDSGIHFALKKAGTRRPALSLGLAFGSNLDDATAELLNGDLLLVNVWAKMLLNAHSTLIQGINGRFEGNVMTYVKPSNYKLIDRVARYVRLLLGRSGKFSRMIEAAKSAEQEAADAARKEEQEAQRQEESKQEASCSSELDRLLADEYEPKKAELDEAQDSFDKADERLAGVAPAAAAATSSLACLSKASISELAAFKAAPQVCIQVMSCVYTACGWTGKRDWGSMAARLKDPNFLAMVKSVDPSAHKDVDGFFAEYAQLPDVGTTKRCSIACAGLHQWLTGYKSMIDLHRLFAEMNAVKAEAERKIDTATNELQAVCAKMEAEVKAHPELRERLPAELQLSEEELAEADTAATAGGSAEQEEEEKSKTPMPRYETIVTRIFDLRGKIDPTDPIVVKVVDSFVSEA